MKVYSLEYQYDYEEDFGGFTELTELIGVFDSRQIAEETANCRKDKKYYHDYVIKEWDV